MWWPDWATFVWKCEWAYTAVCRWNRFVSGVITREKLAVFERLLWRVCRGNVFIRQSDTQFKVQDPSTVSYNNTPVQLLEAVHHSNLSLVYESRGYQRTYTACKHTQPAITSFIIILMSMKRYDTSRSAILPSKKMLFLKIVFQSDFMPTRAVFLNLNCKAIL